jgi:3-methylcrotonyl-CoA carboxylase alpha subunit
MRRSFSHGGEVYPLQWSLKDGRAEIASPQMGSVTLSFEQPSAHEVLLEMDGKRRRAFLAANGDEIYVCLDGRTWLFKSVDESAQSVAKTSQETSDRIVALMPGLVTKIYVRQGDRVQKGQPVVVLEAMKMENTLVAPQSSVIRQVKVSERMQVDAGAVLVELEPLAS